MVRWIYGFCAVASLGFATPVAADEVDPTWDIIRCLEQVSDENAAFTMSTDRKGVTTVKFHRKMNVKGAKKTQVQSCIAQKHPALKVK